jgi:hypothetical protein
LKGKEFAVGMSVEPQIAAADAPLHLFQNIRHGDARPFP